MYFLTTVAFLSVLVTQILCTAPPTSQSSEDNSKPADQHTSELVSNDNVRDVFVKCLLDKGPCNTEAADVKKMLPEAVERGCAKCTEMHRKIIEKMMLHLKERQPEILKEVTAKFDPKGQFMQTFLSKLQAGVLNHSNESHQQYIQNGALQQAPGMVLHNQQADQHQQTQIQQPRPN